MKSFSRLKQKASERTGKGDKTELNNEVQELEGKFNAERSALEQIVKRSEDYLGHAPGSSAARLAKAIGKSENKEKYKKSAVFKLGEAMVEGAHEVGDQGTFGVALTLAGEAQQQIASGFGNFAEVMVEKFLQPLNGILDGEAKEISKATKRLSKTRLDMDAAKSKLSSAPPDKREKCEDDYDRAREKFEADQDNMQTMLLEFQGKEGDHAGILVGCLEAQVQYFKETQQMLDETLEKLRAHWKGSGSVVFNRHLDEHLATSDNHTDGIPYIVVSCLEALDALDCYHSEGIFRLSGNSNKVKMLRAAFNVDSASVDLATEQFAEVNAIAGVLKLYFRTLPNPLMRHELYSRWMAAGRVASRDDRLYAVKDLLPELPETNYNVLKYLMRFLNRLSDFQPETKMGPGNFGIVFGPTLLQSPTEDMSTVMDTAPQGAVVESLVENFHWMFDEDPADLPKLTAKSRVQQQQPPASPPPQQQQQQQPVEACHSPNLAAPRAHKRTPSATSAGSPVASPRSSAGSGVPSPAAAMAAAMQGRVPPSTTAATASPTPAAPKPVPRSRVALPTAAASPSPPTTPDAGLGGAGGKHLHGVPVTSASLSSKKPPPPPIGRKSSKENLLGGGGSTPPPAARRPAPTPPAANSDDGDAPPRRAAPRPPGRG